jgi:hypothetical protein
MLAAAGLLVLAGAAQARTETIQWTQANATSLAGWKIYLGTASRIYTTVIDAAKPTPDEKGVYRFDIDVPGEAPVYVSVTSYDRHGVESVKSNERIKAVGGTSPPDPDLDSDPAPVRAKPYWVR